MKLKNLFLAAVMLVGYAWGGMAWATPTGQCSISQVPLGSGCCGFVEYSPKACAQSDATGLKYRWLINIGYGGTYPSLGYDLYIGVYSGSTFITWINPVIGSTDQVSWTSVNSGGYHPLCQGTYPEFTTFPVGYDICKFNVGGNWYIRGRTSLPSGLNALNTTALTRAYVGVLGAPYAPYTWNDTYW